MTSPEKERMAALLLAVSEAIWHAALPRPIALTIVVCSKIRPGCIAPTMDSVRGVTEGSFEHGNLGPRP